MLKKLKVLWAGDSETRMKMLRYLTIGGLNTAFGYLVAVGLYYGLKAHLHLVVIGLIANIVCITGSFLTYKLFVFRSRASWWREYLRCYTVYGSSAIIGIAGLWLLVDVCGTPFWLAQALLLVVGVVISYIGHDRFTFQKHSKHE